MNTPKRIRVAIVDDDTSLCTALSRLFRAAGMDSLSYSSGEEFLAAESMADFDCLVLDVQLSGMSGLQLQERLSGLPEQRPIIFITAHDEPDTREQAERAGCFAYLSKSDPGDSVLETIQSALKVGRFGTQNLVNQI
jgi:FixJ family two-component response regulator